MKNYLKIEFTKVFAETKPFPLLEYLTDEEVSSLKKVFCRELISSLKNSIKYNRNDVYLFPMLSSEVVNLEGKRYNWHGLVMPVALSFMNELGLPFEIKKNNDSNSTKYFLLKIEDLKKFSNSELLGCLI